MEYTVTVQGTLKCDDEVEPDRDALADALSDALDNADVEVWVEEGEDDDGTTLNYVFSVTDVVVDAASA